MGAADGERIAPVTWLFGAAPEEPVRHDRSPSGDSPLVPAVPVFREEPETQAEAPVGRGRFERVSNVSMYALARRGMSSREMWDYLVGREFDEAEVVAEIERLEGVGLLDDTALAETLVRTLRDRKGFGRSALTAELRRRHLDGVAIETAIGSLDDDELERAVDIAAKRAPQLRGLDAATAKRRLGAFLMRKGYSGSIVGAAVARALEPTGPTFR